VLFVRRDEDYCGDWPYLLIGALNQFKSRHLGHLDVQKHHVVDSSLQLLERLRGVLGRLILRDVVAL
jgi:hypothetical protein